MKVSVYYEEVSNYVEKHYLVRPSIKQVDDKTLSIEYTPHKFIPAICVSVRIEALRKDVICMSYECSKAISLLISGAIAHIEENIPKGIEIDTDSKRINVYPENVTELKNVLAYLSLSGVHISESGMEITLDMN